MPPTVSIQFVGPYEGQKLYILSELYKKYSYYPRAHKVHWSSNFDCPLEEVPGYFSALKTDNQRRAFVNYHKWRGTNPEISSDRTPRGNLS